ncbi:hypothetical protein ACFTZB_12685 [Rhodococcus sp. NPDC057014]|uniref:hypothetical protein n=1 Tax=Rhodococcus sp. NPDC057014 TaxID=3346000 RepID=UPI0036261A94
MPGQPPHGPLLAQKPGPVLVVEVGVEDFDRDHAVEGRLIAAVHHPETSATDLDGVIQSLNIEIRCSHAADIALSCLRIVGHRVTCLLKPRRQGRFHGRHLTSCCRQ